VLEAKICEGSEASSILKDHRKKQEKKLGIIAAQEKPPGTDERRQEAAAPLSPMETPSINSPTPLGDTPMPG